MFIENYRNGIPVFNPHNEVQPCTINEIIKMKYNPQIHHHRSIRLRGYDYSQAGLYFVTVCCENREHRFEKIENGEMVLNEYGTIAYNEWLKTPELRPNVELGEFVIMPNHMHGILRLSRRCELNSPDNIAHELNSPDNITHELNSPEIKNELNSPEFENELNWSDTTDIRNNQTGESNVMGESIVMDVLGEFNSPLRSPSQTIGAIIRGYKSSVTKQLGLLGFAEKLW